MYLKKEELDESNVLEEITKVDSCIKTVIFIPNLKIEFSKLLMSLV